jgi:uncharacterized membrane protein YqjE
MSEETSESGHAPGAATGLFRSLTNLFATLLTLAQTRLELLTTELQEEVQRVVGLLIWGFVALLAGMVCLILGGLTVVIVYWDTYRVVAALSVTAVFFLIAGLAVFVLISKINARPRFLDATLTELARDGESLRNRVGD